MPTTRSPELTALADQLQQDAARELLPTTNGAASVRQATELGATATPLLLERVQARGPDLLLALEALRIADPGAYGQVPAVERAEAYAAALAKSTYFNAWGQPGMQLSETSYALAGLGDAAIAALRPLLDDQRSAPAHGSQDATLSRVNANRVCDFAWVLINEARGEAYAYATAPADRDREIAALKAALATP